MGNVNAGYMREQAKAFCTPTMCCVHCSRKNQKDDRNAFLEMFNPQAR